MVSYRCFSGSEKFLRLLLGFTFLAFCLNRIKPTLASQSTPATTNRQRSSSASVAATTRSYADSQRLQTTVPYGRKESNNRRRNSDEGSSVGSKKHGLDEDDDESQRLVESEGQKQDPDVFTNETPGSSSSYSYTDEANSDFSTTADPYEKRPEHSVEYQLYNNLIGTSSRYLKHVRPVVDHHDAIIVEVGMSVMMIEELIERDQIMVMAAAIKMKWTDCFLSWEPERYGNLTWMAVSSSAIWVPDISIVNSPEPFSMTRKVTHVDIDHNGEVGFYPSGRLTTRCNLHITYFPFDHQHCEVFLESWIHPSDYLKIVPYEKYGNTVDIKEYYTNHQWAILSYEVNMGSADYDGKNFSSITFVYMLRRKSQYYFMYFIFPQLLLAFLQTLSHTLPVEHPGRMAMLTSLFIGTSVTQAGIAVHIPKSSESMSLLQIYMIMMSVNLAIALIVTFVMMYAVLRYPNEEPSMMAILIAFFSIVWPSKPGEEDNGSPHSQKRTGSVDNGRRKSVINSKNRLPSVKISTPNQQERDQPKISISNGRFSTPPTTLRLKASHSRNENVNVSSPELSSPPEANSRLFPSLNQQQYSSGTGYYYDFYDDMNANMASHFSNSDYATNTSIKNPNINSCSSDDFKNVTSPGSDHASILFQPQQLQMGGISPAAQSPPTSPTTWVSRGGRTARSSLMPKSQLMSLIDGGSGGSGDEEMPVTNRQQQVGGNLAQQNIRNVGEGGENNQRRPSASHLNKSKESKKRSTKRGQAASLDDTRDLKRRWLLYCVAVDKTIMYANAAWNIAVPLVLFVIIPATASPISLHPEYDSSGSY